MNKISKLLFKIRLLELEFSKDSINNSKYVKVIGSSYLYVNTESNHIEIEYNNTFDYSTFPNSKTLIEKVKDILLLASIKNVYPNPLNKKTTELFKTSLHKLVNNFNTIEYLDKRSLTNAIEILKLLNNKRHIIEDIEKNMLNTGQVYIIL